MPNTEIWTQIFKFWMVGKAKSMFGNPISTKLYRTSLREETISKTSSMMDTRVPHRLGQAEDALLTHQGMAQNADLKTKRLITLEATFTQLQQELGLAGRKIAMAEI
jgi:hypothetical protein